MADGDYLTMFADNEEIFVGTAPASGVQRTWRNRAWLLNVDCCWMAADEDDDWHNND